MANVKFYITGDNSSGIRAINQVKGAVGGLGRSLNDHLKGAIVGAFGVAAIEESIRRTIEYADNVDEASSRIDVGIEKLQEWTFAAKQSGAAMEDMVGFTEKLSKFARSDKGALVLKQKGINPNSTPEQLVESLWKQTRGKSGSEITPILQQIGGKSAGKLTNTFASDFEEAANQARLLGAVMDEQTTKRLAVLGDQLSIISQIIYAHLGPALVDFAKWLTTSVIKVQSKVEKKATEAFVAKDEILGQVKKKAVLGIGLTTLLGPIGAGMFAREVYDSGVAEYKAKEAAITEQQKKLGIPTTGSTLEGEQDATEKEAQAKIDAINKLLDSLKPKPIKQTPPAEREVKVSELNSKPSDYVSIGGIAGINAQYRIERLNKEQLDQLKKITAVLEDMKDGTNYTAIVPGESD